MTPERTFCALCERTVFAPHRLTPLPLGGQASALLCPLCHGQVDALLASRPDAADVDTLEKLRAELSAYLAWVQEHEFGSFTTALPSRRRRWFHRALVAVGMGLTVFGIVGLVGNDSWVLLDQPGRVVKIRAANLAWHLSWVNIPNAPAEQVADEVHQLSATWRQAFENISRQQRHSLRDTHARWCDGQIQRNIGAGTRAYVLDLWRAQTTPQPGLNLPEPTVFIAGLPGWFFAISGLACLALPALAARNRRKRLRWTRYCRACGYDLTGNATRICPECGVRLPAAMTPPAADQPEAES